MTNVDGALIAPERVRPSYHPVLRATLMLLEEGKPPTYANLARQLRVSKQAVWDLFQRHPDLRSWIARQVEDSNAHFVALVVRRALFLAMQGSGRHTELVLKHHAGAFARREFGEAEASGAAGGVTVNLLVPRPDPTHVAAAAALPAVHSSIPTVKVQR